jgi:hypothetical protein
MGVFDLQKAASMMGGGGNPIAAIGMAYGAPTCVSNMALDLLKMIPSGMLSDISDALFGGKEQSQNVIFSITEDMLLESGLLVVETETGHQTLISDTSKYGNDNGQAQGLADSGGFLNSMAYAAGGLAGAIGTGMAAFNNIQSSVQQLQGLVNCYDSYKNYKASKKGAGSLANSLGTQYGYPEASNILAAGFCTIDPETNTSKDACLAASGEWVDTLVEPLTTVAGGDPAADAAGQFAILYQQMQDAIAFEKKCDEQIKAIGQILQERLLDPSLEPCILLSGGGACSIGSYDNKEECEDNGGSWSDYLDGVPFDFLSGTTICAMTQPEYKEYIDPSANLLPSAIFDLVYGPPLSKEGQFILTVDGLYYDSQSGGVPDVIGFVPPAEFYKFEQPANLGGKGQPISYKDIDLFLDTLFDPDLVDDSLQMQTYYDNDHFLKMLKGERDKHINQLHLDLSSYSTDGSSIAVIENAKQGLISQLALHEDKIRRRKKQLEVAAKASTLYGSEIFTPGHVPINDFTYLKDLNLVPTLEQQKNITFQQADVSEVILPVKPKFVTAQASQGPLAIQHLLVPTIGKGSIVYDASTEGGLSTGASGSGTLYSLTDNIVTDNIISVYNFLNADIEDASSFKYATMNCAATTNLYGNAQLIADSVSSTFLSGLAIPRLKGVVNYKSNGFVAGLGSVVKLPDITEYKDFLYTPSGGTIEAWVHMPGFGASSNSNVEPDGEWGALTLNRILLGCENVGGSFHTDVPDNLPITMGNSVRGVVFGFTRDQQITADKTPTNTIDSAGEFNPLNDRGFFIAPTTSYNSSGVGFISARGNQDCDYTADTTFNKFFVRADTTVSGVSVNDVSSSFVHLCVTFSPLLDNVSLFADGVLLGSSSMVSVFGTDHLHAPAVPSFKKSNSFEYNPVSIKHTVNGPFSQMNNVKLTGGPKLNDLFTPWLVGGGYTDGFLLDSSGMGFMGPLHGVKSGLNGFVGSVKFYGKPLNSKEVLQNYKAQKGFFKNIKT